MVETDCFNVTAKLSKYRGERGNLCHVDCANQGICDYTTGTCNCFNGYYGTDCSKQDARVTYARWSRAPAPAQNTAQSDL